MSGTDESGDGDEYAGEQAGADFVPEDFERVFLLHFADAQRADDGGRGLRSGVTTGADEEGDEEAECDDLLEHVFKV